MYYVDNKEVPVSHRRLAAIAGLSLSAALVVGAAGATFAQDASPSPAPAAPSPSPFEATPGDVTLVAYSTPAKAYAALIDGFGATPAGAGVAFETSFGASGDQSRAVAAGLPADYVAFSLSPDIDRLVAAGIVAPDWNTDPYKGNVTDSVVVLVTRPGNPKGIKGWDDLIRPDVSVITPNPFTSGGARWNIMAAYGAQIKAGKTPDEATQYLKDLFARVAVQDKSARDALQTFVSGQGDVMIAYENEAITAINADQPVEYIVPDATILIENPAAVTVKGGDAAVPAKAFLDYVHSTEGQTTFGQQGYRPVDPAVLATFTNFPTPSQLFTIDDLGGWTDVTKTFFDKDTGIVAGIERDLGVQP